VVNFDVPHVPEDYIHRVGRTARAELSGDAFSLVSPDEEKDFRAIEKHLGTRLPRRTLDGFDYTAREPAAAAGQAAARPQRAPQHAQRRPAAHPPKHAGTHPAAHPAARPASHSAGRPGRSVARAAPSRGRPTNRRGR